VDVRRLQPSSLRDCSDDMRRGRDLLAIPTHDEIDAVAAVNAKVCRSFARVGFRHGLTCVSIVYRVHISGGLHPRTGPVSLRRVCSGTLVHYTL